MAEPTPSSFNSSLCVAGHTSRVATTSSNITFCVCFAQFKGDYCETSIDWYQPFVLAVTALRILTLLYVALWAILKLSQMIRASAFSLKKLSVVSLMLNLAGCVTRLIYDFIVISRPEKLAGTGEIGRDAPELSAFLSVLVTLAIVFFMAATSLIIGFWFDVLQKKLRPTIAARTKIVTIVGACLVLLAIPGLILTIRQISAVIGTVLVIIPLIINVVGMIVLIIIIGCMRTSIKKLAEANRRKQQYALKLMSVSVVFWVIYLVSVAFYSQTTPSNLNSKNMAAYYSIPAALLDMIAEFAISLCIMFLVDRHGGLRRQIGHAFCGVPIVDSKTNRGSLSNTTGSSSATKTSTDTNTSTNSSVESAQSPSTTNTD